MSTDVDKPVQLEERSVVRKGLSGIRHEGMVPAVIHNHGQQSIHVMANEQELGKIYREAGKHHPLELHIGEQRFLALIKDVHFNPVKRRMEHVVFQAIRRDEKVEAEVPVHLIGEVPAEKVGLLVLHQLDHVVVEALPKNLPDELTVDATKLVELHDKLTVADITAPDGVTILTDSEHPIATVVETRAQVADEAAAEEEAVEGEEGETTEGETTEGETSSEDSN
jgi:large subunit ribosomal protein L25